MTAMMIGPAERLAISKLVLMAEASPVDVPELQRQLATPRGKEAHMMKMTAQSIVIPQDILVTYSIETGQPCGRCRHISISLPFVGKLPGPDAVWIIAQQFGFSGSLEASCVAWVEDLAQGNAVNVVQPVAS